MQHPTLHIRDRLLAGLDKDYNVVDMAVVVEVLSQLEKIVITKEALEVSRLGRHINELRRKASDRHLANRAKSLVKKWRQLLVPASAGGAVLSPKENGVCGGVANVRLTSPGNCLPAAAAAVVNPKGISSSLPSSTSTSPGLSSSRPATPSGLSPGLEVPGKRCSSSASSLLNAQCCEIPSNAKKMRVANGLFDGFLSNENTSDSVKSSDRFPANGTAGDVDDDDDDEDQSSAASVCSGPQVTSASLRTDFHRHNGSSAAAVTTASAKSAGAGVRKKLRKAEPDAPRDVLQLQMASVRKSGKVRTTRQIMQDLALRSQSPAAMSLASANAAGSSLPATQPSTPCHSNDDSQDVKSALMTRFLQSHTTDNSNSNSDADEPSVKQNGVATHDGHGVAVAEQDCVAQVLAQLPPIDPDALLAELDQMEADGEYQSDEDMEGLIPVMQPVMEPDPELIRQLHDGQKESLNGNFNYDGAFKEWFEVVEKRTLNDDLLFVLPYSVIE